MPRPLEYNARLTTRTDLTDTLAIFRIRPDTPIVHGPGAKPGFVPGQYVTLGLNAPDADTGAPSSVRRPFSIASAPDDIDALEFYVRRVDHPTSSLPLTHLLWTRQPGDRIHLRPVAAGSFTLRDTVGEDDTRLKILVAAGTGLAPFMSMVRAAAAGPGRLDDLAVLHGASFQSGLGYRDELMRLSTERGLHYIPTVSRPRPDDRWTGATGRVEGLLHPDSIARLEATLRLAPGGLVPTRAVVLVCGLNGTIAGCLESLLPRGYVPAHRRLRDALALDTTDPPTLFWEQYEGAPVVNIRDPEVVERLRARAHLP